MIAIIRWTLWQRRWSIFWWAIAAFGLIFINMIFYPSFKDQAEELTKSFENIPDATLQFIGGSADFFSPVGFLNSQIFFLMLPMILGILAIGLGSSLLAREEQDKTIETLLARPLSRSGLLFAKAFCGIIILAIATAVALATTYFSSLAVDLEVAPGRLLLVTLACFLLALSWGAISFLLTAIGKARGASIAIGTFVALGGYIISSLSGTVEWLKVPGKLFPFHYYQSEEILNGHMVWGNLVFFVCIIIACGGIAWWAFRQRDLS